MITLCYSTARPAPMLEWFFDSLKHNNYLDEIGQIIIVDRFAEACDGWTEDDARRAVVRTCDVAGKFANITQVVPPKPCVWSGKHRLTPRNWWSASSYRNTALCYATGDYIVFLDDRCVVMPTFMDAVHEAREKQYVVGGCYEKHRGLVVKDGYIVHSVERTATDCRMNEPAAIANPHRRRPIKGDDLFGCAFGLPVPWMLQVNGQDESWDSISFEDCHFGKMLENNGFPICHDGRMKMVEDRTPAEQDSSCREHDMKRSSKEKHPHDTNDKTHTLKRKLWGNKRAVHQWNMREIRENVLRGGSFPPAFGPSFDWFDGQKLKDMT